MIDPLSLAVGAGILAVGFLAGRIQLRKAPAASPLPTCSCGHVLAMHDRETNACHVELKRDRPNGAGGHQYVRCFCRRYTGPVPLEDVWAPQVGGGGGA